MTRADFLVAPSNALALQSIEGWQDWPGRKLLLIGPEAAGKTHLVQVWAALADAVILQGAALATADIAQLSGRAVAVDNADRIGQAEADLFHLHNLVTTTGAQPNPCVDFLQGILRLCAFM